MCSNPRPDIRSNYITTHKQLLVRLNDQEDQENRDSRVLIWAGIISGILAFSIILLWIYNNPRYQKIAVGVFGTSSVVGGIATALYLLLREGEIKTRNVKLMRQIEAGMDAEKPELDDEFYINLTTDKLDGCLKEAPKNLIRS